MSEQPVIQAMLERCPNAVRTDTMSYEDWLDLRRNSIGGSDAGSLMLLNGEWGTPYTVYGQKKGWEESKEMSVAAKRGKLLEPVMRDWFAQYYPDLEIIKVPYMFYSKEHPFMSANLDGLVYAKNPATIRGKTIQGIGGLEIKSSKYGYNFGEDEIPDSYYAQVQHYMVVMEMDWVILYACFLDTEETQVYVILRDKEFIPKMIAVEKNFWENNVLADVIPASVGFPCEDDMITGMYEGSATTIALSEEEKKICGTITDLGEQIKTLKEQQEAAKIDLKTKLVKKAKPSKTERKLSALGGRYKISWTFLESRHVDTEALKKEGLYDKFCKITETDRLTVSIDKKAV
ncbi:YqaJ viral recombinase family nuclease [Treponema sp. R6D11]